MNSSSVILAYARQKRWRVERPHGERSESSRGFNNLDTGLRRHDDLIRRHDDLIRRYDELISVSLIIDFQR